MWSKWYWRCSKKEDSKCRECHFRCWFVTASSLLAWASWVWWEGRWAFFLFVLVTKWWMTTFRIENWMREICYLLVCYSQHPRLDYDDQGHTGGGCVCVCSEVLASKFCPSNQKKRLPRHIDRPETEQNPSQWTRGRVFFTQSSFQGCRAAENCGLQLGGGKENIRYSILSMKKYFTTFL